MADHNPCSRSPEEVAEEFVLRTLPPEAARAFEDHCRSCERCAATLAETVKYVEAVKRATAQLLLTGS
jgi:anti-sigma factor RsiW